MDSHRLFSNLQLSLVQVDPEVETVQNVGAKQHADPGTNEPADFSHRHPHKRPGNRKLGIADTAPAALPEARRGTRIDQNSFLADLRQDVAVHKVATIGVLLLEEVGPTDGPRRPGPTTS